MSEHLLPATVIFPDVPLPGMTSCELASVGHTFFTSTSVVLVSGAWSEIVFVNRCLFSCTHHSKSKLLSNCETSCSFPDPSHIYSSPPFRVFPLPFLPSMPFPISHHLLSIHFFSISISLLLSIAVLLHVAIPAALPFLHYIFSFICPLYFFHLFIFLPIALPSLSHGISSSVMMRLGTLYSSILHLSCPCSFLFPVALKVTQFIYQMLFFSFIFIRNAGEG